MCLLNTDFPPALFYILQIPTYNTQLCISVYTYTQSSAEKHLILCLSRVISFGFRPAKPLLCVQQGNDNIYLLVIIYVWRAKPNVWVGLQRPKMGRFFFIHRTQLHLNKPTPSERLAPTENTRQPQTLKLNHSPKSRSHQHIVKNSLYFFSIYIYRQIMHITNEKKWSLLC